MSTSTFFTLAVYHNFGSVSLLKSRKGARIAHHIHYGTIAQLNNDITFLQSGLLCGFILTHPIDTHIPYHRIDNRVLRLGNFKSGNFLAFVLGFLKGKFWTFVKLLYYFKNISGDNTHAFIIQLVGVIRRFMVVFSAVPVKMCNRNMLLIKQGVVRWSYARFL